MWANTYLSNLNNNFIKPLINEDFYDVYHIFNIRHKKRDELRNYMLKHGVQTEIHYPVAPNKQVALQNIIVNDYPLSNEIHNTTLSLPISSKDRKSKIGGKKRELKLTVSRALSDEIELKSRSLASLKRAKLKENRYSINNIVKNIMKEQNKILKILIWSNSLIFLKKVKKYILRNNICITTLNHTLNVLAIARPMAPKDWYKK